MSDATQGSGVLGTFIADLVLEFDNQKGYEFRVQCEVKIPNPADATELGAHLAARDFARLGLAKEMVLQNVDKRATPGFRKLIADAFDDNAARIKVSEPGEAK